MQIPFETCPLCGGHVEIRTADREIHVGKRTAVLQVEAPTCADCGEYFLSPDEMDDVQIRASELIRKDEGLLLPASIERIRKALSLSQAQFEKLLGVGPKTVVRWERGTVFQNSATDNLLRILSAVPEAVAFLAQRQGVDLSAVAAPSSDSVDVRPPEATFTYRERKIPLKLISASAGPSGRAATDLAPQQTSATNSSLVG